jgi:hypothetical protein
MPTKKKTSPAQDPRQSATQNLPSKDNLPAIITPNPDDYHITLPGTEVGIHREAHVVFMVDTLGRTIMNLNELKDWYFAHGWFLDVATSEPEPEQEKKGK